jgi:hypothetical protein
LFSRTELFFFRLMVSRLTMLLQHRVLAEKDDDIGGGGSIVHGPGADESTGETEEQEQAERALRARIDELQRQCAQRCSCATLSTAAAAGPGAREHNHSDPRNILAAPTLEINFGLPRPPGGVRARCTSNQHIHLPSFLHLNLLLQQAMLDCTSGAAFSALLRSPRAPLLAIVRGEVSGAAGVSAGGSGGSFSLASGLLLLGVFQHDLLEFHARKARLGRVITFPQQCQQGGIMPGFLNIQFSFLQHQFKYVPQQQTTPTTMTTQQQQQKQRQQRDGTVLSNSADEATTTTVQRESVVVPFYLRRAPEFLPAHVHRPARSDELWVVDASNMPDPPVQLDTSSSSSEPLVVAQADAAVSATRGKKKD